MTCKMGQLYWAGVCCREVAPTPAPTASATQGPTTSPTPAPTEPAVVQHHSVRKGRVGGGCKETKDCAPTCASDEAVYAVRCCSDVAIQGWRKRGAVWSESDAWKTCERLTYSAAREFCSAQGGRLCSDEEVEHGLVRGTGCHFDAYLIWTKDECTPLASTLADGGVDSPVIKGQASSPRNGRMKGSRPLKKKRKLRGQQVLGREQSFLQHMIHDSLNQTSRQSEEL